jgi:hypothetical protein
MRSTTLIAATKSSMRGAQIGLIDNIIAIRHLKIKKFRQQQHYKKQYVYHYLLQFRNKLTNINIKSFKKLPIKLQSKSFTHKPSTTFE